MNLMLLRLLGRERELNIRLAVGGTRWQIARLVLIESIGLSLAAALLVVLATRWRDVKHAAREASGMHYYVPDWMYPPNISTLLLQLDQDPGKEFTGVIRRAIYNFDPNLITTHVTSIRDVVDSSMRAERYTYIILRGLSTIALALAVIGLFSVIAYTVSARTREFGVRLALGAQPGDLHRLVLQRGLASAGLGIVIGIGSAFGLTQFMKSLLFETTPYDPLVYLAVTGILLLATIGACWLPARRAAKVDPMAALRCD